MEFAEFEQSASASDRTRASAAGEAMDLPAADALPSSGLARALGTTFEIAFLGYLAAIAALTRQFGHLHLTVHGLPFFTGELAILALTVLAVASLLARGRRSFRFDLTSWTVLTLIAAGAVLAVRGMLTTPGLAVVRDFALVYYGWFFILTLAYLRHGGRSEHLLGALLVGATLRAVVSTGHSVVSPFLTWGHATGGYNGIVAWTAVLLALAAAATGSGLIRTAAATAGAVVCGFEIFFTGYRTLLVVIGVSVVAITVWSRFHGGKLGRRYARLLWAWLILFGVLILVPRATIPSPQRIVPVNGPVTPGDAFGSLSRRWTGQHFGALPPRLRGGLRSQPDPQTLVGSAMFRLAAWRNALARIKTSPWIGIGFGSQALLFPQDACDTVPSATSNCGTAHNTYVTLAMRAGLPLTVVFCALMGWLLVRSALVSARPGLDPADALVIVAAATALLSFLIFGCTSLLLESPYLSTIVWVLAGILAHETGQGRAVATAPPA